MINKSLLNVCLFGSKMTYLQTTKYGCDEVSRNSLNKNTAAGNAKPLLYYVCQFLPKFFELLR